MGPGSGDSGRPALGALRTCGTSAGSRLLEASPASRAPLPELSRQRAQAGGEGSEIWTPLLGPSESASGRSRTRDPKAVRGPVTLRDIIEAARALSPSHPCICSGVFPGPRAHMREPGLRGRAAPASLHHPPPGSRPLALPAVIGPQLYHSTPTLGRQSPRHDCSQEREMGFLEQSRA